MQAFAPGIYPRSERLVQATRDLDRGRTSQKAVDEQVERDLAELVSVQQQAGLDLLTDGMLRWQDLFRPMLEATSMDALFGRWHTPTVLLADRLDDVEAIRRAIRAADDRRRPFIGQVVTVYDILPGPPSEQQAKLALLGEIRKLARDPAVELLDAGDRRAIADNLPPADLRVLGPLDLPPLARRPFTETDGSSS